MWVEGNESRCYADESWRRRYPKHHTDFANQEDERNPINK